VEHQTSNFGSKP